MKRFIVEYDIWKKKDLENAKEAVVNFEVRLSTELKQQEKLDMAKKRNFERRKLSEKYMAKILYGWNDKKFKEEYLKNLERIGKNRS